MNTSKVLLNGKSELIPNNFQFWNKIKTNNRNSEKDYLVEKKLLNDSVAVDNKLRIVLLLTVITLIIYKIFEFLMPYASTENVEYIGKHAHEQICHCYNWISNSENLSIIYPFIIGIGFSLISWITVYMDCVNPKRTSSSIYSSKYQNRKQLERLSLTHINSLTALASGVVITILMFINK